MKIIKPFKLGVLPRCYSLAGQAMLDVGVFLFFRLGRPGDKPEILKEHEAWPLVTGALPAGTPLDVGMHKTRGELLLSGAAFAPGGRAVTQLDVRVRLANVDKRLKISGDRSWVSGLISNHQESAALPFVRMSLSKERAFGGPGFEPNPKGTGYLGGSDGTAARGALPNLALPGQSLRAGKHRDQVATFLPDGFGDATRIKKLGTYDRRWLQHDFPGFARDVDWSLFNVAPADQQLRGDDLFKGGEGYRLENLHPEHAVIEGALPAVRARCFAALGGKGVVEMPARADTVWLFPEQEIGAMVFHGSGAIEDDEGLDVETLMVAYEDVAAAPRPLEHYVAVMALRSDRKTAGAHAFDESQLCAPGPAAEGLDLGGGGHRDAADLSDVLDGAPARAAELADAGQAARAALQLKHAAPMRGPSNPDAAVTAALNRVEHSAEQAERRAGGVAEPTAATSPTRPEEVTADAVGAALGDLVQHMLAAGMSLVGLDLTGAHLQGIDLSGHDLRGVTFAYGRLLDIKFADANLTHASFVGSTLERVNLERANLAKVEFGGAVLKGTCLRGAQLSQSKWHRSRLTACVLSNAEVTGVGFTEVALTDCRMDNAQFRGVSWLKCRIERCSYVESQFERGSAMDCHMTDVDLSRAELRRTVFLALKSEGLRFDGAQLERVLFGGASELRGSSFRNASILDCGYRTADLTDSNFEGASLSRCDLAKTTLTGASFAGALVSRCVLREAEARRADFRGADFYQSVLTKARFEHSDMRDTSLLDVEMRAVSWRGADLRGAEPQPGNIR